jgi:hypothetical protein
LPPTPLDSRWLVNIGEKTYGPYTGHEIKNFVQDGRITATDWLCPEGGSSWVEAKNEPNLGSLFRPGTLSQPASRPVAHTSPQTRDPNDAPSISVPTKANLTWGAKWKQKKSIYSSFFQRADQESICEDLAEFFGPRADKYLAVYEKMRSSGNPYVRGWNWIVFFTTFPWFFYRKMYIWGALFIFLPPLLGYLFGLKGNAGIAAGMSVMGNSQYVLSALSRLKKADMLGLVGEERKNYLRRAGGVSIVAGTLSSVLFAAMLAVVILGVYLRHKSAH